VRQLRHDPIETVSMYDLKALSSLKLAELKEFAKKLRIAKAETLKKQDLITKIMAASSDKDNRDTDDIAALAVADEAQDPEPDEEEEDEDDAATPATATRELRCLH
jgi:DNA-directed RNA polymerase specialized sigma subunit